MKCLALSYFWCKHECMEDIESFVDVLGFYKLRYADSSFAAEHDMVRDLVNPYWIL